MGTGYLLVHRMTAAEIDAGKADSLSGGMVEVVGDTGESTGEVMATGAEGSAPTVAAPEIINDDTFSTATAANLASAASTEVFVNNVVNTHAFEVNPHGMLASDLGLGEVSNTSDASKPLSAAAVLAFNSKVDDSQVLTDVPAGAVFTDTVYEHPVSHSIVEVTGLQGSLDSKVNDSQVLTDVPTGAEFTDTVYVKPTDEPVSYIAGLQATLDGKVENGRVLTDVPLGAEFTDTETTTVLTLTANTLSYTDEVGAVTNIDLSLYLDDTNLSYLVSGVLDGGTGIATFTRSDATSFTVDMSALLDDTVITVEDLLTSVSTSNALSANQGKVLNDRVLVNDGKITNYDQTKSDIDALGVNAATVAGLTVETAVPIAAEFTDTVYTHPTHVVGDVTGLQTELDGKADSAQLVSPDSTNTITVTDTATIFDGSKVVTDNVQGDATNTNLGAGTLDNITSLGLRNTAIGFNALQDNTDGDENVGIGYHAMKRNLTGIDNTGIGRGALYTCTSGDNNTAIGKSAGYSFTGTESTFLGALAGSISNSGSGHIMIGYRAHPTGGSTSNELNIGDAITGDLATGYIDIPGAYTETTVESPNMVVAADGSLQRSTTSVGMLRIREVYASGVAGGDSTTGSNTRQLNVVDTNGIVGASLAAGQITLPAGSYVASAAVVVTTGSGTHRPELYNVTDTVSIAKGTAMGQDMPESLTAAFTLAVATQVELRSIVTTGISGGLGSAKSFDGEEQYAEIVITKVD